MSRNSRDTIVRFAQEASYGSGTLADIGSTDAVVVSDPRHRIERKYVRRDLVFPHLGASEELVAARVATISFGLEITGSGAAGTPPPWARLLRACGFAQTVVASRVEWNPISRDFPSLVGDYRVAGVRYLSRGMRGRLKGMMLAFGIPKFDMSFTGFDTQAAAAALPAYDLTAYQRPVVLTDENAGDIRLGGTLSAGTVTGGTVLASRGLEIDFGQKVEHLELLGGEAVDITDRELTGRMSVAVSPADEVAWRAAINTNEVTSLGFNWGTAAGHRWTIWAPRVQRVNPQHEDYKGRLLISTELRFLPTAAGNDEILIILR